MRAILNVKVYVVLDPGDKPCAVTLRLDAAYGIIEDMVYSCAEAPDMLKYVSTQLARDHTPKHSTVTYKDIRDDVETSYTVWEL